MKKENKKDVKQKREKKLVQALALSQIFIFILSSFAFAFIIGGMAILSGGVVSGATSSLDFTRKSSVDSRLTTFSSVGGFEVYRIETYEDGSQRYYSQYGTFLGAYFPDSGKTHSPYDAEIVVSPSSSLVAQSSPPSTAPTLVSQNIPASVATPSAQLNDDFDADSYDAQMREESSIPTTSLSGYDQFVKILRVATPAKLARDQQNPELTAILNSGKKWDDLDADEKMTLSKAGYEKSKYNQYLSDHYLDAPDDWSGRTPAGQYYKYDDNGNLYLYDDANGWVLDATGANPDIDTNTYTANIFGMKFEGMSYAWGGLFEGLYWATMVGGILTFLGQILPEKQKGIIQPLGMAIAAGAFTGRTTWGLVKQFGTDGKMPIGFGKTITAQQAGMIVGILAAYLVFASQYKKEKEKTQSIEFKCLPWQAPLGGADCNKCNGNALQPCSEYRCKSLGQTCKLLNAGTGQERCIDSSPNDVTSPGIKPWLDALSLGYKYTDRQDRPPGSESPAHVRIVDSQTNGCLKAFTPFTFGIVTTDKGSSSGDNYITQPAQCKIDFNHTLNYDAMNYYLGDTNLFVENHSQSMSLPGTANLNSTFPEIKNDGEYTLYIRCKDGNGNENLDEYAVRFCIDKSPDLSSPIIKSTSIPTGSPVLYQVDNLSIGVYTNEPSTCKWSRQNIMYNQMENSMTCNNNIWEMNTEFLYTCNAQLTGIKDREDNTFYFSCRDMNNNTMAQTYEYKLIGTQPLNILSTGPKGTLGSSTSTSTVTLQVSTDNGYNNGASTCYYSSTGSENDYIAMFETSGNTHKQNLDLTGGVYNYYFKCVDLGGNTDYNYTNFSVYVDRASPQVTRVYSMEAKLIISTNEDSVCSYSTDSCNFGVSQGIVMPIDNSINHFAEWKSDQTYYIKCKDSFGNEPSSSECSTIIRPYTFE
jgi:hypothetical protein